MIRGNLVPFSGVWVDELLQFNHVQNVYSAILRNLILIHHHDIFFAPNRDPSDLPHNSYSGTPSRLLSPNSMSPSLSGLPVFLWRFWWSFCWLFWEDFFKDKTNLHQKSLPTNLGGVKKDPDSPSCSISNWVGVPFQRGMKFRQCHFKGEWNSDSVFLRIFFDYLGIWQKCQLHKPSGLPVVKARIWDWQRREDAGKAKAGSHVKQVLR